MLCWVLYNDWLWQIVYMWRRRFLRQWNRSWNVCYRDQVIAHNVLQTAQMRGVCCAAYCSMHCKEPLKAYRKQRWTIFSQPHTFELQCYTLWEKWDKTNVPFLFKAIDHSMCVSYFSCTPAASISVISVVLSGYRCVPLFVHSGQLL